MNGKGFWMRACAFIVSISLLMSFTATPFVAAQEGEDGPVMLHPQLDVRTVVDGLDSPTTMAFLGPDEFLVLEKNTGQVQHVMNGEIQGTVLDLAVNFASERGLLGIALHPDFPTDPGVYLYWSCIAPPPPEEDPFFPTQEECAETPEMGEDNDDVLATPLLGNRVDRFVWDGGMLTYDHNLIMLRSFQHDAAPEPPNQGDEEQPPRGNHDGGVLEFGLDDKLYIFIGDVGRRGLLQNLPCGPTDVYDCPGEDERVPDDQFGGPEPDDAHLTGAILRLNPDGTAPEDNPFFEAGATIALINDEVGENIQKIFSYGHRNSFGLAVDPASGNIWLQENGDDTFSELNLVEPGLNSGWVQIMGPAERVPQYKEIETTFSSNPAAPPALQQLRWPPENIADTPQEALDRLFMLPGATFDDPEFSWRWEVAPGGIGFVNSNALGPEFENDLFVGAAIPALEGGYLFHFNLTGNRDMIAVDDPRLEDRVADNEGKHEITESESLLIGRNFGSGTDIETGPNGNVFVVSLTHGAVFEIFRVGGGDGDGDGDALRFEATLTGDQEVPPVETEMRGDVEIEVENNRLGFVLNVRNNMNDIFAAHIHCAPPGENGPVGVTLFLGSFTDESGLLAEGTIEAPDADNECAWTDIDDVVAAMQSGNAYVNVHTTEESGGVPSGEIRGDLLPDDDDDDDNGNGGRRFSTELSGEAEVPGPGDPDGTGMATIRLNPGQGEVCFELTVSNIEPATAAHIHQAPVGEAGPVVVPLEPPTDGSSSGCVSDVDRDLIQDIIQNPDQYYVNVHNEEFPDGAVRGQLTREGNGDDDDEQEFEATLTGDQEVPPVETEMLGDVDVEIENNRLEVVLNVRNNINMREIFAAHIHCAPPGENGPVGVTLFMGSFTEERGLLARVTVRAPDADNECGWTDVDDIATAIQSGNAYVNVHTTEESGGVPSGEIRGDLLPDF